MTEKHDRTTVGGNQSKLTGLEKKHQGLDIFLKVPPYDPPRQTQKCTLLIS